MQLHSYKYCKINHCAWLPSLGFRFTWYFLWKYFDIIIARALVEGTPHDLSCKVKARWIYTLVLVRGVGIFLLSVKVATIISLSFFLFYLSLFLSLFSLSLFLSLSLSLSLSLFYLSIYLSIFLSIYSMYLQKISLKFIIMIRDSEGSTYTIHIKF